MTTVELTQVSAAVAAELENRMLHHFQVMPTLTLDQAAAALGVSNETMRKLCSDGKIPHIKLDRVYRIKPADLNNYLESRYSKQKEN